MSLTVKEGLPRPTLIICHTFVIKLFLIVKTPYTNTRLSITYKEIEMTTSED